MRNQFTMAVHLQKITVDFEYPVYFTKDVFDPVNVDLREAVLRKEPLRRHRIFTVIDQGVADAWPGIETRIAAYANAHADAIELLDAPEIVPGGEIAKSDPQLISKLQMRLFRIGLDRQSFVLTVGGGAVQDMAGYAASLVHRGVRVIRVPTTVLSQNDSGVGVKNGINAFGVKNFLGVFAPPFAVLNDIRFIDTLGARDRISGMAEAVKVALIRDAEFFRWLEERTADLAAFEPAAMARMIERGAMLHLTHIATSGDPFEFGAARPLDFGHWSAHKLESLTDYRLRHGEAIAIGMAIDARYSFESGLLAEADCLLICRLMERLGLPLWDDALLLADAHGKPLVLGGLKEFREHLGGELTVTLLEKIGCGIEVHEIEEARVLRSMDWLRTRGRPQ